MNYAPGSVIQAATHQSIFHGLLSRGKQVGYVVLVLLVMLPVLALRATAAPAPDESETPRYVIHISVDGLRPDAIVRSGGEVLPNFYRFRTEGAFTDNARTDFDYSNTLPNHIAQLTGRRVIGLEGHGWTSNSDPDADETLHTNKGAYVASVFDVAHDHGLRTGAYVSKSKFALLDQSYDDRNGAADVTGEDNGRDKIDTFVYEKDTADLVERFIDDMRADPYGYVFLHLRDPDAHGHRYGWNQKQGSAYMKAVKRVDTLLGQLFEAIDSNPNLAGRTAVVLTSDHGGSRFHHADASHIEHYAVPFYMWGPGVPNQELYVLNSTTRQNPGLGRPGYDAAVQPIRNGEAANVALGLLGLGPVPGAMINTAAVLHWTRPSVVTTEPATTTEEEEPAESTTPASSVPASTAKMDR